MSALAREHGRDPGDARSVRGSLSDAPEPTLDDLAWLATQACDAPIAGISITDDARTWFKSLIGFDEPNPMRDASFFELTARGRTPLIVPDALEDAAFAGSPLVTSEPRVRFYAGAPLISLHGHTIGALFVMDRVPRALTREQAGSLAAIARQVANQLDLRKSVEDLRRAGLARERAESRLAESEAILASFYESAPVMMGVVELGEHDFIHISANRAASAYLEGAPSATTTPRAGSLLLPKEEASRWLERFREAHARRAPVTFEAQHATRSDLRWVSAVVNPLASAPGGRPRLCYLVEDITSWKRILEDLRMNEERLALALDSAQESLWDWDIASGAFFVNKPSSEREGRDPDETRPRAESLFSQVHPDDLASMEALVHDHVAGRTPFFEAEARTQLDDGSWTWTLTVGKIVARDPSGSPLRMIGTRRDVSERKRLDAALTAARDKALETSRAKSAFLANMSHELRTPLNAILGYVEILEEQSEALGSPESPEDLARLKRAARHLLGLINDILDLSKIESGELVLRPEPFAVADLVRDIVASVKPLVEKQANQFEVSLGPELGVMRSDPARIRQCLLNLLGNAAKFTQSGLISLKVERRADGREGSGDVSFVVSDTGVGIAADQMNRLFQDFSQASTATTRRFGGTGLGLSITRRLCRLMGGDVEAQSVLGEGSTFTIRLPVSIASSGQDGAPPLPKDDKYGSNHHH